MSAIVGIIQHEPQPSVREQGRRMLNTLNRLPADDVQAWEKHERIFLGCHAQWITPESVGERNPLVDEARELAIAADAIIDNRDELFDRLQIDRGLRRGMTDAALILLAYERWGEDCPKHLVGDFAFVIWDERLQRLFAARDFSGTRTLYYSVDPHKRAAAFATVMAPLLALPFTDGALNESWIAEFLAIPFTVDTTDNVMTVRSGIRQVPPAHAVVIGRDMEPRVSRYFDPDAPADKLRLKSNAEYEEALRGVLHEAVASRLRTFKHVGAQLSGGLDSGTVASFASRQLKARNKRLHTFSYVPVDDFEDWTSRANIANEKAQIQCTVDYAGNMQAQYLDFKGSSPFSVVDDWLDVMEMPYKFFENSFWIKGIYEQAARQNVGVLLNGQRGNWTVSWGPALDYYILLLRQMRLFRFYREINGYCRQLGTGRKRVLRAIKNKLLTNSHERYYLPEMVHPELAARTNVLDKIRANGVNITGEVQSAYEVKRHHFRLGCYWNLNGTYATKLSLRTGLVARDPTNDLRVVRFCRSVPESQFVQDGVDRSLIRRVTAGYLPDAIRLNQRTRGAQGADGVHRMAAEWPAFIREVEAVMADGQMEPYLNKASLRSSLDKIKAGPRPEFAYDLDFRNLMRSVIFRRFIHSASHERG